MSSGAPNTRKPAFSLDFLGLRRIFNLPVPTTPGEPVRNDDRRLAGGTPADGREGWSFSDVGTERFVESVLGGAEQATPVIAPIDKPAGYTFGALHVMGFSVTARGLRTTATFSGTPILGAFKVILSDSDIALVNPVTLASADLTTNDAAVNLSVAGTGAFPDGIKFIHVILLTAVDSPGTHPRTYYKDLVVKLFDGGAP